MATLAFTKLTNYEAARKRFFGGEEGNVTRIYSDDFGLPTIGIGALLMEHPRDPNTGKPDNTKWIIVRKNVEELIGIAKGNKNFKLTDDQWALLKNHELVRVTDFSGVEAPRLTPKQRRLLRVKIARLTIPPFKKNEPASSDVVGVRLTQAEVSRLFNHQVKRREIRADRAINDAVKHLPKAQRDKVIEKFNGTRARLALVSIIFNAGRIRSDRLVQALLREDRASAYFEMLFESVRTKESGGLLLSRRRREFELVFGRADPSKWTDDEKMKWLKIVANPANAQRISEFESHKNARGFIRRGRGASTITSAIRQDFRKRGLHHVGTGRTVEGIAGALSGELKRKITADDVIKANPGLKGKDGKPLGGSSAVPGGALLKIPPAPKKKGELDRQLDPDRDGAEIREAALDAGTGAAAPDATSDDVAGRRIDPRDLALEERDRLSAELGFNVRDADASPARRAAFNAAVDGELVNSEGVAALPEVTRAVAGRMAVLEGRAEGARTVQKGLNRLAEQVRPGEAPTIPEDGDLGPRTVDAAKTLTRSAGDRRVAEALAVSGFEDGLEGNLRGEGRGPARLFDATVGALPGGRAKVRALQETVNGQVERLSLPQDRLKVDGDLGPRTEDGVIDAARATGARRFTQDFARRAGLRRTADRIEVAGSEVSAFI